VLCSFAVVDTLEEANLVSVVGRTESVVVLNFLHVVGVREDGLVLRVLQLEALLQNVKVGVASDGDSLRQLTAHRTLQNGDHSCRMVRRVYNEARR